MIHAFRAAFRGLLAAWKQERHLKIHTLAATAVVGAGFWLNLSALEWAVLVLCFGLVFGLEYLNSALERLANRVDPQWHELIRDAKDFAAAGVLAGALAAAVVGALILGPKLWTILVNA
ncbi:MAG: diacylglycerol kinase family protein [Schleiferiaceae bacterium]